MHDDAFTKIKPTVPINLKWNTYFNFNKNFQIFNENSTYFRSR